MNFAEDFLPCVAIDLLAFAAPEPPPYAFWWPHYNTQLCRRLPSAALQLLYIGTFWQEILEFNFIFSCK